MRFQLESRRSISARQAHPRSRNALNYRQLRRKHNDNSKQHHPMSQLRTISSRHQVSARPAAVARRATTVSKQALSQRENVRWKLMKLMHGMWMKFAVSLKVLRFALNTWRWVDALSSLSPLLESSNNFSLTTSPFRVRPLFYWHFWNAWVSTCVIFAHLFPYTKRDVMFGSDVSQDLSSIRKLFN